MLGKRLVALRKEKGLTQQELATELNLSRETYAQYEIERRNPDYGTLRLLANFFGVTTDYLLGHDEVEVRLINIDGKRFTKEQIEEKVKFALKVEDALKNAKLKPEGN